MPGITLFVLGMHRSGTSAMTGVLNICGAWVGNEAELTQASIENPIGFWERRDIREICDKLLQSAGADWWKIAGFDPKAIPRTILTEQRRKFQKVILTLDEHETWVIKEPRLCLLLPVLRQYVRNPVCIYMYRNPLEVARSLQVRNGFSISSGLALWEVYNFHALNASEGLPRIFVSFEALMIRPIETLKEIAEKLEELVGSHTVKPERKLIEQFIDPNLYRQRVTEEETCDYLLPSQQALWSRLHNDEALDDYKNIPISEATTQSLLDLESVEVSFILHQDTKNELQARIVKYTAALKAREERIGTLEGSNSRLQANLDKHKETLKAREERIGTLEGSNSRLQANLDKHKETLKAREERIGTLEGSNSRLQANLDKHKETLKAREERIGTLEGSNSRLQANLDKHKETLKAREERIGTLEGSNSRLQANLDKHKETLKAREERIGTLEGSNSRLQANLDKHKETLKAREERIGTLEGSNSRLQANLDKHKETLKAREERIGTLEGSNSRLQANLDKHKETLKAREERIGTLEGSNSRLQANLDKHKETLKAREERIGTLEGSNSRLQANLDKHKETLKAREERIGTLEGSNSRLQANLDKHKETLKAREERIGTLEGSNSRLQANLDKHKETLKAREKTIDDLYNSTSWKITAPLRVISRSFRWFLRNLRRVLRLLFWLSTGQFSRAKKAVIHHYTHSEVPHYINKLITRRRRENAPQEVNSNNENLIKPVSTRTVAPSQETTYIVPASWWEQNPMAASFITQTAQGVIVLGGNRIATIANVTAVAGIEERVLALAAVTTETAIEIRADAKWNKAVENGELPQDGTIKLMTFDEMRREFDTL